MANTTPVQAPTPPPHLSAKLASWAARQSMSGAFAMIAGAALTSGYMTLAYTFIALVGIMAAASLALTLKDHKDLKDAVNAFWEQANGDES